MPIKFHSDTIIITPNLATSRELAVRCPPVWWIEAQSLIYWSIILTTSLCFCTISLYFFVFRKRQTKHIWWPPIIVSMNQLLVLFVFTNQTSFMFDKVLPRWRRHTDGRLGQRGAAGNIAVLRLPKFSFARSWWVWLWRRGPFLICISRIHVNASVHI